MAGFKLERPDAIEDDVLAVLKPMGSGLDIPMQLLEALEQYVENYTDAAGPTFTGGSYLQPEEPGNEVKPEQTEYDITESYSISITLCLSAKGFLREFQRTVERAALRERIEVVVARLDERLTAAMVGLLRSFVINVLEPDSMEETLLLERVSQGRTVGRTLTQDLRGQLQAVRDRLPELTFGLPPENERILRDYPDRFFECGWTWGAAEDATDIDLPAAVGVRQPHGVAESRPMLHFTVSALDGLADLFSARTSRQGLLTSEQQPLREALNLRWGLALQYWATIATFGTGRWPMEDVPWTGDDGRTSPYFTELVLSVVSLNEQRGIAAGGEVVGRSVGVLEELAQRGRVNRRAVEEDRGINLHDPGVSMPLRGSEADGPRLAWVYTGYAATLAKIALRLAGVTTSRRTRARLIEVADSAVDHLLLRRQQDIGLWDDPANAFPGVSPVPATPSWDITERVVEVFVAAATLVSAPPLADQGQIDQANAKIAEARHILDQERLTIPMAGGAEEQKLLREVEQLLNRADGLVSGRPATASALADKVLRDLDELAFARQAAIRSA
ncbi:MAG: hypothetical protein HOV87_27280 [Catenulispora sp.]|nr:hypothetical protein [Catenulispora sp.]